MGAVRSTLSFRRRLRAACRLKTLRPIRQISFVTTASEPHRPRAQSHDRLHYAASLVYDAVSCGKDHLKQKYAFIRDYDDNKRGCSTTPLRTWLNRYQHPTCVTPHWPEQVARCQTLVWGSGSRGSGGGPLAEDAVSGCFLPRPHLNELISG